MEQSMDHDKVNLKGLGAAYQRLINLHKILKKIEW